MNITTLKQHLQLPENDTSNDVYLQLKLDEAIEWVLNVCNKSETWVLPKVAEGVIAQYVAFELQGNSGIKSESIGGMSQTFDSVSERNNALIAKLSQVGLRRVRFKRLC